MMIDTAPLRAALRAAHGKPLAVMPDSMQQLLDAIDTGNAAQRQLKTSDAIAGMMGGRA